ncbi:MAG: aspartate/glutamate racemase family protein [Candidatus Liptonbacteria bacterium]|nr:aspartate/glutamate racemase family protein [Candidatus Liptonbacteria bacterium]
MEGRKNKNFRVGILGGMGPMAGVLLQRLIIEATPASRDQDHLEVICFTNPKITDRTDSLMRDGGESFTREIVDSIKVFESMGVDVIAIPCHTAHTRFLEIQRRSTLPILNLVKITIEEVEKEAGRIGILATTGTIREKIYRNNEFLEIIEPDEGNQEKIMEMIYRIKGGELITQNEIEGIAMEFKSRGVETLLLACTEFSLYFENFDRLGLKVFDPLRILARYLVELNYREKVRVEFTAQIE